MGRRVWLGGEEWDAAQSRPSIVPSVGARLPTGVVFTRLSDGFEVGESVGASSLDAATISDLQTAIQNALDAGASGPRTS